MLHYDKSISTIDEEVSTSGTVPNCGIGAQQLLDGGTHRFMIVHDYYPYHLI